MLVRIGMPHNWNLRSSIPSPLFFNRHIIRRLANYHPNYFLLPILSVNISYLQRRGEESWTTCTPSATQDWSRLFGPFGSLCVV
jgi:hypothetical protein